MKAGKFRMFSGMRARKEFIRKKRRMYSNKERHLIRMKMKGKRGSIYGSPILNPLWRNNFYFNRKKRRLFL